MRLLVSPYGYVIPNVDLTGEITDFQIESFVEPIPLKARADVELNLPDTDLLPPIDLGGLRFTNAPNVPITVTPSFETPDTTEPTSQSEDGKSEFGAHANRRMTVQAVLDTTTCFRRGE